MNVTINLKTIRVERGLTQAKLSQAIGMTVQHLQKIENSRKVKSIPLETIGKLCQTLECEPGDLLKLEKVTEYD